MASIFVITHDGEVEFYPLGLRSNVIGRDASVPIQVVDKKVSRKHLQLRYDRNEECYYAIDMNSRNGVFVNGKKIEVETVLADGDRIGVGNAEILFTLKDFPERESALHHFKKVGEHKVTTE
jgi:pSer/pThr/pTyr-binding forkhead associated (FHA) protein